MQVNYQIYDQDFTGATPIFQKFHWGILCCDRTTPGEVNAPVAHPGVDLCGRWYLPNLWAAWGSFPCYVMGEAAPVWSVPSSHLCLLVQSKYLLLVVRGVAWARIVLVGHLYSWRHQESGEKAAAVTLRTRTSLVSITQVNCLSVRCWGRRDAFRNTQVWARLEMGLLGMQIISMIKIQLREMMKLAQSLVEPGHNWACLPPGECSESSTKPKPVKFGLKCQSDGTVVFFGTPKNFSVPFFNINGPVRNWKC